MHPTIQLRSSPPPQVLCLGHGSWKLGLSPLPPLPKSNPIGEFSQHSIGEQCSWVFNNLALSDTNSLCWRGLDFLLWQKLSQTKLCSPARFFCLYFIFESGLPRRIDMYTHPLCSFTVRICPHECEKTQQSLFSFQPQNYFGWTLWRQNYRELACCPGSI